MLRFTHYKTAWLAVNSSHCLAALPAKMSAFNSHMRQNAATTITWSKPLKQGWGTYSLSRAA